MNPELIKLERELASSCARSDIERYLDPVLTTKRRGMPQQVWYRRSSILPEAEEFLFPALRYLELRKLLDVHPDNPDLVRPINNQGGHR